MKVAVLLYGHVRTFEQCLESFLKNVVDINSCDVFIHTWDTVDHNTKSWYMAAKETPNALSDEQRRIIMTCYKPKKIRIEHQPPYSDEKEFTFLLEEFQPTVSTATVHYIFYSMNQANLLRREYEKEHNFSYDIVLVTRPDIAFFTPLDLEKIVWQAKIANINLSNVRFTAYIRTSNQHHQKLLINRVNDLIFFGSPAVIDRFISANINLAYDFIVNHALNYCSIYLAAELSAGLMPVHMSYCWGDDWKNILPQNREVRRESYPNVLTVNPPAKVGASLPHAIKCIAKLILFPLKKFYQWSKIHLPWITQD